MSIAQLNTSSDYRVVTFYYDNGMYYSISLREFNLIFKDNKNRDRIRNKLYIDLLWVNYLNEIYYEGKEDKHTGHEAPNLDCVVYGLVEIGLTGKLQIRPYREDSAAEFYNLYTVEEDPNFIFPASLRIKVENEVYRVWYFTEEVNTYQKDVCLFGGIEYE